MLTKIYLAVLLIAVLVVGFLYYYSWSWLQSIGAPGVALGEYQAYHGLAWSGVWVAALILLAIGNAVLWATGRAWGLWATFAFFTAFVLLGAFWIRPALNTFLNGSDPTGLSTPVGPVLAVVLIALAGVIVYLNNFIGERLRTRVYPAQIDVQPAIESDTE